MNIFPKTQKTAKNEKYCFKCQKIPDAEFFKSPGKAAVRLRLILFIMLKSLYKINRRNSHERIIYKRKI